MLITIIAVHWEGKVEQEIDEFFHSSRDASNVQIQVLFHQLMLYYSVTITFILLT